MQTVCGTDTLPPGALPAPTPAGGTRLQCCHSSSPVPRRSHWERAAEVSRAQGQKDVRADIRQQASTPAWHCSAGQPSSLRCHIYHLCCVRCREQAALPWEHHSPPTPGKFLHSTRFHLLFSLCYQNYSVLF